MEKRKRNLKTTSPISRREREICIPFHQFREEKEKSERIFSTFEKEIEILNTILQFREEKENIEILLFISRVERDK